MPDIEGTPGNDRESHAPSVSPDQIRARLERVLQSEGLKGTSRLRELLSYVVLRSLSGPTEKIPAKAIAQDLYGRSIRSGADNVNVVRVDAGRARRRLSAFYAGSGRDDPVIIHLDSGGYTPRFEVRRGERQKMAAEVEPVEPAPAPLRI